MPRRLARSIRPLPISLAVFGLAAGCSRASGDAVYRDPAFASAPEWRVATDSGVMIGREDAGPKYQLFNVLSAVRRPDGAIVVGDGTGELRFYDASGRFVHAVGRKGRGPGEFQIPDLLVLIHGDSLAVWDGSQDRVSVFDSAGVLGRTVEPRFERGYFPNVVAIFAGGGLAVKTGSNARAMAQRSGMVPDSAGFGVLGPDGAMVRDLGRVAVGNVYVTHAGNMYSWSTPPFGRELYTAGSPAALYVADGGTNRISIYAPDGRQVGTIEGPFAPRPVTSADLRRLKKEKLDQATDPARHALLEQGLNRTPAPDRTPSIGAVAADRDGLVWVQEYPRPGAAEVHWAVVHPDGRVAARVRLPRGWDIYQIGPDWLLAGSRDENDVEHVHLLPLRRTR
jgi:hypothetical protein